MSDTDMIKYFKMLCDGHRKSKGQSDSTTFEDYEIQRKKSGDSEKAFLEKLNNSVQFAKKIVLAKFEKRPNEKVVSDIFLGSFNRESIPTLEAHLDKLKNHWFPGEEKSDDKKSEHTSTKPKIFNKHLLLFLYLKDKKFDDENFKKHVDRLARKGISTKQKLNNDRSKLKKYFDNEASKGEQKTIDEYLTQLRDPAFFKLVEEKMK